MTTLVCRKAQLIGLACAGFAFSSNAITATGSDYYDFPWVGSKELDSGAKDEPSLVTNMRGDWGAFVNAWNSIPQQCIDSDWQRLVPSNVRDAGKRFSENFRVYGVTKQERVRRVREKTAFGEVKGTFTDSSFSADLIRTSEHFRLELVKPLTAFVADVEAGRARGMSPPSAACRQTLATALKSAKAVQDRVSSRGAVDEQADEKDFGQGHSWESFSDVSSRSPAMQHRTDKLVHDFEVSRVAMVDLQCSQALRDEFEKQMAENPAIRSKSGSPLGDAPLRSVRNDLERVESAEAAMRPFLKLGDSRCATFANRAFDALGRLKDHLVKEREGLQSNNAVYETLVENDYRAIPGGTCEVLLVDSSSSTDNAIEKEGKRMSRSEYLKSKALAQLARLPSNVGGRSGLVVFGQKGLDLYASSSCAQVAATVPLAATASNRAAMEAGISKIRPSDDSPVTAGIVEAIGQTNGCKGERIVDVAWDFDMGGTDGCTKEFCKAVAHLWNRGIRVKLRFVPIRNTEQKSQSFLKEIDCVKAFSNGVEIVGDGDLFGKMFTNEGTAKLLPQNEIEGEHAVSARLATGPHKFQELVGGQIYTGKDGKLSNGKTVKGAHFDDPDGPQSAANTSEGAKSLFASNSETSAQPVASAAPVPPSARPPLVRGHEMDDVAVWEKKWRSKVRSDESPEDRVAAIESLVFGEKKEGPIFDRVKRLRESLGEGEATTTQHGGAKSIDSAMPPTAPSHAKNLFSDSAPTYARAMASDISLAPKPDPLSAATQAEAEKVLRPGLYRGEGIDPTTHKKRACTVAVTYAGQWNFRSESMVQVNAWFDGDVKADAKGTARVIGKTWNVAFGQPDAYSDKQPTLSYAPEIGKIKDVAIPVPVIATKAIGKGNLKVVGHQIGYRFADEDLDKTPTRELQNGYQLSRPVKSDTRLKLVEKSFDVNASMDSECNLSEIKISVQNKDLAGAGSFTKENYDAWKNKSKSFATDNTMTCKISKRETDPKKVSKLPPHQDRCQASSAFADEAIH